MASLRVVLDTNVILSGLAYPSSVPGRIIGAWQSGAIEVYLSEFILEELRRVLPRLRRRHRMNDQEIDDLIDILGFQTEVVTPNKINDPNLRDSHDQPVLGTLTVAIDIFKADYLITGDKDLLELEGSYPIVTPAVFWSRHGHP